MTNIQPNKDTLDAFARGLASPVFESREAYLEFCRSAIQMYAKTGVRPPETPSFRGHLEKIKATSLTLEQRYEYLVLPDIKLACDFMLPIYKSSNAEAIENMLSIEIGEPVVLLDVKHLEIVANIEIL